MLSKKEEKHVLRISNASNETSDVHLQASLTSDVHLQHATKKFNKTEPFSMAGTLMTLFVSARGSLVLFAIGRLAAVGLSAIFLCKFSLRARVRSNSFWGSKMTCILL